MDYLHTLAVYLDPECVYFGNSLLALPRFLTSNIKSFQTQQDERRSYWLNASNLLHI